jgi:thiamine pyrophosphokinase
MKCVIIASGELDYSDHILDLIKGCSLIICADGGARHLRKLDILPHVLMGDFDSIDAADKRFFEQKGVHTLSFPPEKDKTDSELCIDFALKKKATDITLLGFTGTRLDHTIANIFLLKQLSLQQIPARIINKTNEIHIVTSALTLSGRPGDYLSLIPLSEKVEGVTLKGLVYPLTNADILMGSSLGVSNCFQEKKVTITIKKGILIVTRSKDSA